MLVEYDKKHEITYEQILDTSVVIEKPWNLKAGKQYWIIYNTNSNQYKLEWYNPTIDSKLIYSDHIIKEIRMIK